MSHLTHNRSLYHTIGHFEKESFQPITWLWYWQSSLHRSHPTASA